MAKEEKEKAEEEARIAAENGGEVPAEETATEEPAEETAEEADLDLAPMPEEFEVTTGNTILTEDQDLLEDDDLPTPEEADADRDFTENK